MLRQDTALRPQDSKRVLLFTNDADPFRTQQEDAALQRTLTRVKDMGGTGMQVELWHVPQPVAGDPAPFDLDAFYEKFLQLNLQGFTKHIQERSIEVLSSTNRMLPGMTAAEVAERTVDDCVVHCSSADQAITNATTRWVTKRTLKRIELVISSPAAASSNSGSFSSSSSSSSSSAAAAAAAAASVPKPLRFSMKAYALIRPAKLPSKKNLDGVRNTVLNSETTFMCPSTGSALQKHQISTYFMFGKADRVTISPEELAAIKSVNTPSQIRLLGFKPHALVKPHHQFGHPTFLYPDDECLQGSLAALVALRRRMLARKVVGICAVKMRPRSEERLAA
jgi:hypothetical protein